MPILLLEKIKLFEASIQILGLVLVPRVAWIVDVGIGPFVGEDNRAVWRRISERVEDVRKRLDLDVAGLEVQRRVRRPVGLCIQD